MSAPRTALLLIVSACAGDKPVETGKPAHTGESGGPDSAHSGESAETAETAETAQPDGCVEDAAGDIPAEATWITLDGASSDLLSFDRTRFSDQSANDGTWNPKTEVAYGGNGFKLARGGTVVGAAAMWDDLSADEPVAATLDIWPDYSSDGYFFDAENPYGTATRCLTAADAATWVAYLLPTPVRIDQPLHVFAGYTRDPDAEDQPDLYFENAYNEAEPFYSGARFPNVDDRYYYGGTAFPWYTWEVRLAVVYDAEIADEDKPFRVDSALSVSSRVAWGDYDHDGDDDLMTSGPGLYRNDGGGTFTSVSAEALPSTGVSVGGGVWGDYDNDGCLDFFGQSGSYTTTDLLLHANCDGTFSDATPDSGITDFQDTRDCDDDGAGDYAPTEGAAWFDMDNDGFLDLYLANYECPEYSDTTDPDYFGYYRDRLFRNNGDGTFTDYTDTYDVDPDVYAGRGATTGDVDQDGWTDLFISNYRLNPNFYFQNTLGVLADVAGANGTQGTYRPRYGSYGHTIGSAFGDIDNDGDFDLISANLAHPFYSNFSDKTQVLINDGGGIFSDEAAARGIYYRETHSNPTLFDADTDGDLDLFITAVYPERDSDLYINDGTGHFTLTNYQSGLLVRNGWGAAAADWDQDGDVDMVAYNLYTNHEDDGNHWLEVTAVGGMRGSDASLGSANRSAIGAVMQLTDGARTQLRHVSGGSGTSVQDSLTQHFGLGDDDHVDELRVLFPGGAEVLLPDLEADQRIWVCEDGTWSADADPCD